MRRDPIVSAEMSQAAETKRLGELMVRNIGTIGGTGKPVRGFRPGRILPSMVPPGGLAIRGLKVTGAERPRLRRGGLSEPTYP